ncbi:MAG: hypothetical protein CMI02_06465 [Oceanospirillaceae bacterium]|nr:hypothetical protein [Oceanospirillaceae bacterium]MBT11659.1 hypothetical protein [Oceanospirillaceae bacterium]|tara:strand:+ start:3711 stop:3890 length:180 start_codon:yes stop_codon:yes gene_type:complete
MSSRKEHHNDEYFDDVSQAKIKARGRSADYEKKRRRAERILEQARLRDMLGYDVDYPDV